MALFSVPAESAGPALPRLRPDGLGGCWWEGLLWRPDLLGSTDGPSSSLTSCHLCDSLSFQKTLFDVVHTLPVGHPRCFERGVGVAFFFNFLSLSLFFVLLSIAEIL